MGKLLRLVLVVKRAESSTPQIQGPQHSLVQDSSGLEQNPAPSRVRHITRTVRRPNLMLESANPLQGILKALERNLRPRLKVFVLTELLQSSALTTPFYGKALPLTSWSPEPHPGLSSSVASLREEGTWSTWDNQQED